MRFMSRYKSYRIGLIPSRYVIDSLQRRQFIPGKSAQFSEFEFETQDKELIKLMFESSYYGVDFWSTEAQKVNPEAQKILEQETQSNTMTETSCPYCTFKAKTNFGLKAHLRIKHKQP